MVIFDEIANKLVEIFKNNGETCEKIAPFIVNRDINGRVRLIVDESHEKNKDGCLQKLGKEIADSLTCHAHGTDLFLYELDIASSIEEETSKFVIDDEFPQIWIVDRTITESNWSTSGKEPNKNPTRATFFSIKGGVGRSAAIASTAISFAKEGKKILVVDLDLESPGVSFSLLEKDRRLPFGITDWLVEDLVDNGDNLIEYMVANPQMTELGELYVLPSCGSTPGEYISKLGRVFMPKIRQDMQREKWFTRLNRLISDVERRWGIDFTLIDSRAGLDEFASACVTELGASFIFLFVIDGEQTWNGYKILVDHWQKIGCLKDIREKLQIVGALVPEFQSKEYKGNLTEKSWNFFIDNVYDSVEPNDQDKFSFDVEDKWGSHFPIFIDWNRNMFAPRDFASAVADWKFSGIKDFLDERGE